MIEKFKTGLRKYKERLLSNLIVYNIPENGVEFEFVFGGEYTPEQWEEALTDLYSKGDPKTIERFEQIIKKANESTRKERVDFVDFLMAPSKGIIISENARELHESRVRYNQFLININSMSETNLANLQKAINEKMSKE